VIYVGKAQNLRARVRQYFAESGGDTRLSIPLIRKDLDHIETIITTNEKEAFLLENTLIKRHRPRYNVRLRDDKTYVSIRIDLEEVWPRIEITRARKRDKALYFGPYTNVKAVRKTVNLLQKVFPLRTCSNMTFCTRTRPCVQAQIGRCCAPCTGQVDREEYNRMVKNTVLFLKGRNDELVDSLRSQMEEASEKLQFERAAILRDRIVAIDETAQAQRVASHSTENRDVVGLHTDRGQAALSILMFRRGQLVETLNWLLPLYGTPTGEALSNFLGQYYDESRLLPREILLPAPADDKSAIEEWLTELRGGRVELLVPERGEKVALVGMANTNAREHLERKLSGREESERVLEDLAHRLHLTRTPRAIECYDIATLQGAHSAGSKVEFVDGEPHKAGYRLYKIRTVEGQDDYAMMREVLIRRFRYAVEKNEDLPDLVVVDGGKGQLNMAVETLNELGLAEVPLAALVKEHLKSDEAGESSRTSEMLFLPERKNPVVFPPRAPSFYLLQRLRDEAHRFVNAYHGKARRQSNLRSPLLDLPGIGPVRVKALLRHFGSLTRAKSATLEELQAAPNMNRTAAETVYLAFQDERSS
ncbi:excinuclease ABC subunit UvrC, partial [bacterium]|nr:excinuclease ABC subunit UvrC [bacterium]